MPDPISITISSLSFAVSALTFWLTNLRRGTVRMTQPTVFYFGPDAGRDPGDVVPPKVFLRTLLISTSKRGHVIESMHIRLRRGESTQIFNVWAYGERNSLVRGSGVHVGPEGIACNHHFLLPPDGTTYQFLAGTYEVEVFAHILGRSRPLVLGHIRGLQVSESLAARLKVETDAGIYFDWGPESGGYHAHLKGPPVGPKELARSLHALNEFDSLIRAAAPAPAKPDDPNPGR